MKMNIHIRIFLFTFPIVFAGCATRSTFSKHPEHDQFMASMHGFSGKLRNYRDESIDLKIWYGAESNAERRAEAFAQPSPCALDNSLSNWHILDTECKSGMQNGYAEAINRDGSMVYAGEFRDGHIEGEGALYDTRKHYEYIGTFKNGILHGWGALVTPHGGAGSYRYVGKWVEGKQHGLFINTMQHSGAMVTTEYTYDMGCVTHRNGSETTREGLDGQEFCENPKKQTLMSGHSEQQGKNTARSIEERLREIDNLRSKGLISDKEYKIKRKEILGNI